MMHGRFKKNRMTGFILLLIAMAAIASWVIMLLWNNVLTAAVAGIKLINFWQAAGILVLAKILFGGKFGRRHPHHRSDKWRNKLLEKWETMNDEEREKFRNEWRSRRWRWQDKY